MELAQMVREVIQEYVAPAEVLGDVAYVDGEWRSLVAASPSGPLISMGFQITKEGEYVRDDSNQG